MLLSSYRHRFCHQLDLDFFWTDYGIWDGFFLAGKVGWEISVDICFYISTEICKVDRYGAHRVSDGQPLLVQFRNCFG